MTYRFHFLSIGFNEQGFEELESQIDSYAMGVKLIRNINPDTIKRINAPIVDFDTGDLDRKLSICKEILPNRPIIGLFKTPIELENIVSLQKPFDRSAFSSVLNLLDVEKTQPKHDSKEINAIYSHPDSFQHYPIKNCFQEHLVNAWKIHQEVKQPIELIFLNKPILVIYDNKVSAFLSYEKLEQLCGLTIQKHSISTAFSIKALTSLHNQEDAVYFIAQVALWSSRGRLPEGISSVDFIRVIKRDMQDNLPKVDGSEFIKDLWLNQGSTLQRTEQVLQVRQTDLFSYLSMLYALDYVEVFPAK
ncbi:MAG: hypothetical protein V3V31_16040 [Methylococcales bacterium]